jgi:hypothetical protein
MADAMVSTALLAVAVAVVLGVLSFLLFALPNRPPRATAQSPAAAAAATPAPAPSKKPGGSSANPKQRALAADKVPALSSPFLFTLEGFSPSQSCNRLALSLQAHPHRHHHLELNTLKGHGDAVTDIAFASNGRGLATGAPPHLFVPAFLSCLGLLARFQPG